MVFGGYSVRNGSWLSALQRKDIIVDFEENKDLVAEDWLDYDVWIGEKDNKIMLDSRHVKKNILGQIIYADKIKRSSSEYSLLRCRSKKLQMLLLVIISVFSNIYPNIPKII